MVSVVIVFLLSRSDLPLIGPPFSVLLVRYCDTGTPYRRGDACRGEYPPKSVLRSLEQLTAIATARHVYWNR
jgi:hypothetical protein